jgi:hypothetical protein
MVKLADPEESKAVFSKSNVWGEGQIMKSELFVFLAEGVRNWFKIAFGQNRPALSFSIAANKVPHPRCGAKRELGFFSRSGITFVKQLLKTTI